MKILTVGDTHGSNVTPYLTTVIDKYDKVVCVGDYTDSFEYGDKEILFALNSLIELKKKYPDKLILLLGNHDLQYMFPHSQHRCSGYRPMAYPQYHDVFEKNKELFQFAYQEKNYLWTHAGVNKKWYKDRFNKFVEMYPDLTLAQQLNLAFKAYASQLFIVGFSRGGNERWGGPVWTGKEEMIYIPLANMNQIVGHTKVRKIEEYDFDGYKVVFVDTLQSLPINKAFYELEI